MESKKQSYLIRGLVLIIGLLIFGGMLYVANRDRLQPKVETDTFIEFKSGRVVEIIEDNSFIDEDSGVRLGDMLIAVEMSDGRFKGEEVEAQYFLNSLSSIYFQEGDRVSVRINSIDGEILSIDINNIERTGVFVVLILVFLGLLAAIGGKRGVMSVLGLIFTMVSILFLLIPLMLQGYPVILTTLVILSLVTVVILILLGGVTPKTIAAILGCIVGSITAALIAGLVGHLTHISGNNMEDVGFLMFSAETNGFTIDPSGLFISGVLIASLGAVMDTAMSITSALEEIKLANPEITDKQLFKSGMNVGRDVMGTMSNTLILAFTGTALNLVMLLYADNTPLNQIINNDFIGIELIRSVAGSLGIVLTVPAVAFIGAKIFTKWDTLSKRIES